MDVDNEAGIRVGLEHLVALGHTRIAMVSAQLPGDNPQRRDAFIGFMVERFGGVRPDYIQDVPNTMAGGEAALDALLELETRRRRSSPRPTSWRSASSMPRTAAGGSCRASSRSWASTTSPSRLTRRRR